MLKIGGQALEGREEYGGSVVAEEEPGLEKDSFVAKL